MSDPQPHDDSSAAEIACFASVCRIERFFRKSMMSALCAAFLK